MSTPQGQFLIFDKPSLVRRALETQITMQTSKTFAVKCFDQINEIEKVLDRSTRAIFIDIFVASVGEVTEFIGVVRNAYPWIVFVLWVNKDEFSRRLDEIPSEWQRRFGHYFSLDKNYSTAGHFPE